MKETEEAVVVEQIFDLSLATVWNAITECQEMKQWFFDNIPAFEARIGFETKFIVENNGRIFPHLWKITEVQPLKKICYNWKYEGYPGDSVVVFELIAEKAPTLLRLTHEVIESFPDHIPEFRRESCLEGWNYFIKESLKGYLENKNQS